MITGFNMLNKIKENTEHGGNVEETLIFRIAAGDTQALARLYKETKTAVFGFILSIVRNVHAAEDIMQDTYVKIYTSAPNYQSQGKPMA